MGEKNSKKNRRDEMRELIFLERIPLEDLPIVIISRHDTDYGMGWRMAGRS